MIQRILNRHTGGTIYECEAPSLRAAVERAVRRGISLAEANLSRTDLAEANLSRTDLAEANLSGTDLHGANLCRANLSGTDLTGTCLDPEAEIPLQDTSDWERADDGRLIGWRTDRSTNVGHTRYTPGWYTAPWFSVDVYTDCHPGLYVWQTRRQADAWAKEYGLLGTSVVRVLVEPDAIMRAGRKWRCVRFEVAP